MVKEIGKDIKFQSPQWGDNSKVIDMKIIKGLIMGFSPRNGEIILKTSLRYLERKEQSFSPRNGEIILKGTP